jgi:hypothetical protein
VIDHAKNARLQLELELERASLRGFTDLYQSARDDHDRDKAQIVRDMGNAIPDAWHPRGEIADLLTLPAADLLQARVDLNLARRCVAARERMNELHRRVEALRVKVTPLALLCDRLNAYALKGV